jgi:hypothetical protein
MQSGLCHGWGLARTACNTFPYTISCKSRPQKSSPTQSPIACGSMKMKVHQTLVWLNLLSFGTKDLAAPTIGIHYTISCKALYLPQKRSPTQSPVACRSMNMKVHQTLVWLNLLSFGTKDLAAPTSVYNQLQITTHCSAILSL